MLLLFAERFAARFNVCLIVAIASPPIALYHSGVTAELIRDEDI
jgi:hypothetical protein